MSRLKPELSEKNPYYIPKHRYYELYHFCLQYPTWVKAYNALDGLAKNQQGLEKVAHSGISDPTAKAAESAAWFMERINMVDHAAEAVDPDGKLYGFLILNATQLMSYETMNMKWTIPVSKDEFYKKRREFFWRLSKARN